MMFSRVMQERNVRSAPAKDAFLPVSLSRHTCQEFAETEPFWESEHRSSLRSRLPYAGGKAAWSSMLVSKPRRKRSCVGNASDLLLAGALSLRLSRSAAGGNSSLPTWVHRHIQGCFSSKALLGMSGACQVSV